MNLLQRLGVCLIRFYQWAISPLIVSLGGPTARCRFTPSCSQYALEAITRHGFFKGCWYAFLRLLRCNPWGPFGYDPVPGTETEEPGKNAPESHDTMDNPRTIGHRVASLLCGCSRH